MVTMVIVTVVLLVCCAASSAACYRRGRRASTQPHEAVPSRRAATVNTAFEPVHVGTTTSGPAMYETPPGADDAPVGERFYETVIPRRADTMHDTPAAAPYALSRSVDASADDAALYETPLALNPAYGTAGTAPAAPESSRHAVGPTTLDDLAYARGPTAGAEEYVNVAT
jgi:hypothetical protein